MAKKKKTSDKKARVHKDLEGFEIKVNPLGEITSNYDIDQINKFLDKNVYDKKLVSQDKAEDEEETFPIEDSTDNEEDTFLADPDDDDPEIPPRKPKGKV